MYNQLSSREIWNIESMSIFRQVQFYRDADVFESDGDVLKLYEALKNMGSPGKQAALGYKFKIDDPTKAIR